MRLTRDAVMAGIVSLARPDGCANVGKSIIINAVRVLVRRGGPDSLGTHALAGRGGLDVLWVFLTKGALWGALIPVSVEPGATASGHVACARWDPCCHGQ